MKHRPKRPENESKSARNSAVQHRCCKRIRFVTKLWSGRCVTVSAAGAEDLISKETQMKAIPTMCNWSTFQTPGAVHQNYGSPNSQIAAQFFSLMMVKLMVNNHGYNDNIQFAFALLCQCRLCFSMSIDNSRMWSSQSMFGIQPAHN